DALREASLQELDEGVDGARAVPADGAPAGSRHRSDRHLHVVHRRAADERRDAARADLQIDHRSVAHVGPSARQPIREVAIAFEVVAPGFAPERPGNRAAFDHDRRYLAALLLELRQFARGLSPSSADRDVGLEAVVVAVVHPHSMDAVWRSSATSFNRSSSLISVNSTSPPPSSRSWDSWRLESMS